MVSSAQTTSAVDAGSKVKAVFLYNFTRYFEWQQLKESKEFRIGILGKHNDLDGELNNIALKKKVGNKPIKILMFNNIKDLRPVEMLYFDGIKNPEIRSGITSAACSPLPSPIVGAQIKII